MNHPSCSTMCRRDGPHRRIGRAAALAAVVHGLFAAGCMSLPRATCSDEAFAAYIHTQAEKLPIPGIYELRTSAAGGHVTLGGRVDSPETLKQLVTAVGATPGLCELSFFGMEFCPPDIPDDEIAANARAAACRAIGEDLANQLGYYCEDHFLIVYGTLPSSAVRAKVDDAVRAVPGVAQYHVSCEVVLQNPPSDDEVVRAVKRKLRRPLELPNLTFRASQIEVTSRNNIVHLTGKAPTFLGRMSAGQQAAQVEGIRYVVNHIQVPGIPPTQREPGEAPPEESTTPDEPPGPAPTINPSPSAPTGKAPTRASAVTLLVPIKD